MLTETLSTTPVGDLEFQYLTVDISASNYQPVPRTPVVNLPSLPSVISVPTTLVIFDQPLKRQWREMVFWLNQTYLR
jgi:hypothetical protein